MFETGPTPRVQGRYFVVAPGTVFPKICVRTGRREDLVEIGEGVKTDYWIEHTLGALAAAFSYQRAEIRYWIHQGELERLKGWRRICNYGILCGIAILALGLGIKTSWLWLSGFAAVCAFVTFHRLLPAPLNIAAVWGDQVFLLKLPPEIIGIVLAESRARSRSG